MDISNRKSLLMTIHKTADDDTLRSVTHPGENTNKDHFQKLIDMESALTSSQSGNYSEEQQHNPTPV